MPTGWVCFLFNLPSVVLKWEAWLNPSLSLYLSPSHFLPPFCVPCNLLPFSLFGSRLYTCFYLCIFSFTSLCVIIFFFFLKILSSFAFTPILPLFRPWPSISPTFFCSPLLFFVTPLNPTLLVFLFYFLSFSSCLYSLNLAFSLSLFLHSLSLPLATVDRTDLHSAP